MSETYLSFFGELNAFLPAEKRQIAIPFRLNGPVAAKHPIEALGVPHTEVDLILANESSVDFSYLVQPGDRLGVYPVSFPIKVMARRQLRPPLPSPPQFVVDTHLGQLARYLRLLGFDALYGEDDDEKLAQIGHEEGRVLLTRDRRLLMRKLVIYGYCLLTRESDRQLQAVLQRFDLTGYIEPWHRCLRCNGYLQPVAKETVLDRLEPKTKKYYHEFHICQDCQQIYWKGSHYEPLQKLIDRITLEA
jgi:uncharacterized protein with PIN domain